MTLVGLLHSVYPLFYKNSKIDIPIYKSFPSRSSPIHTQELHNKVIKIVIVENKVFTTDILVITELGVRHLELIHVKICKMFWARVSLKEISRGILDSEDDTHIIVVLQMGAEDLAVIAHCFLAE